jgi:fibrinogen-binding protein
MKKDLQKMCETLAATSLGISDDNIKLAMWKELCSAFKQSLNSDDSNNLEEIGDICKKMSEDAKISADEILKTSGDDTKSVSDENTSEIAKEIDNTDSIEDTQNTQDTQDTTNDNSACDKQAENAMAVSTSSLNQDDAQFSIDDDFEEFCDSGKSNILPKDNIPDNDADIGNSKDVTSDTDNPDTKDVNLELKEWTGSTTEFVDNSIKEFVTPDLEKWKFSTGLCSKRSGKLARVFNTDTPLFESGYNLLGCEFIDKDKNAAGVVNEFSEFWDGQYKLLTNDEANLKKVNINSLLDITKNAVVVPFAKENETGEIVTDTEIFNREKEYAKKYFRYYKDFTTSADEPGFDESAYNAVVGSNEGHRILMAIDRITDRFTLADMLEKFIMKFPNLISLIWLIGSDEELNSMYLPNTTGFFNQNPLRMFEYSVNAVKNDEIDLSLPTREALSLDNWIMIYCYITKRCGDIWFTYPSRQMNKKF